MYFCKTWTDKIVFTNKIYDNKELYNKKIPVNLKKTKTCTKDKCINKLNAYF